MSELICPRCHGTGSLGLSTACPDCNGTGHPIVPTSEPRSTPQAPSPPSAGNLAAEVIKRGENAFEISINATDPGETLLVHSPGLLAFYHLGQRVEFPQDMQWQWQPLAESQVIYRGLLGLEAGPINGEWTVQLTDRDGIPLPGARAHFWVG